MCVFGHHPHPLGYLCAKFRFFGSFQCRTSQWKKSRTQSLTQSPSLSDVPGMLSLQIKLKKQQCMQINSNYHHLTFYGDKMAPKWIIDNTCSREDLDFLTSTILSSSSLSQMHQSYKSVEISNFPKQFIRYIHKISSRYHMHVTMYGQPKTAILTVAKS